MTQFETVPAWRIARLRLSLREAKRRGQDAGDSGADLMHRALARRFAFGREQATRRSENTSSIFPATRKGRSFPLAKRTAIWRAILAIRPVGWKPGDRAIFGAIAEAHRLASAYCRNLNLPAPRYRTVYLLWHRGVPGADVMSALGRE